MSALKKPVSALIGVMAVLLAGLFFAVSPASAAPAAAAPIAVAAPHAAGDGYGNETITITFTVETLPDGRHKYTLTITGFKGGEIVIIFIHSTRAELGSTTANADGTINTTVTIPASYKGAHTLEAVGQTSGVTASTPIQLGGSTTGTGSGSGSGSGLSSTGVAVVGIGALGVVLLAGGGLLLIAGRRRKIGEI
jgi:hypothetical protein